MNQNPWYVDGMAQYERDRIRSELKQIRLEEKALKASQKASRREDNSSRAYRPSLLMRIVLTTVKWLIP